MPTADAVRANATDGQKDRAGATDSGGGDQRLAGGDAEAVSLLAAGSGGVVRGGTARAEERSSNAKRAVGCERFRIAVSVVAGLGGSLRPGGSSVRRLVESVIRDARGTRPARATGGDARAERSPSIGSFPRAELAEAS
jgi:hypothetical protein